MGLDVDWQHGADHMRAQHQVTVQQANEALADTDALLFDPDPKSTSAKSARLIGYSPTAAAVPVVILVRREDRPGSWSGRHQDHGRGANGWRANSTDRRTYAGGKPPS
jgi:uncharacterized DUF497 family protein